MSLIKSQRSWPEGSLKLIVGEIGEQVLLCQGKLFWFNRNLFKGKENVRFLERICCWWIWQNETKGRWCAEVLHIEKWNWIENWSKALIELVLTLAGSGTSGWRPSGESPDGKVLDQFTTLLLLFLYLCCRRWQSDLWWSNCISMGKSTMWGYFCSTGISLCVSKIQFHISWNKGRVL